ncbi:MAG: DUF763 domain-containing protein [Myxococcales bacterium]|nr:DUF763 domain-containing protein [Myxococcales bacterium]
MSRQSGRADLPLHHGRVPPWLASRMARLGRAIVEVLVLEEGRDGVLRRLAHPGWFQCFGSVMGMDWHSSGITTSVLGALKRGLGPVARELGIHVCGGRGRHSRRTPDELRVVAERTGLDGEDLVRSSRLVAKVDSAAVQDGFQVYLHGFIVTDDGRWVVVQQGLNPASGMARRYHWLSEGLTAFDEAPHAAVTGPSDTQILNLVHRDAAPLRKAQLELVERPDTVMGELRRLRPRPSDSQVALTLPGHHAVHAEDVNMRRLWATLVAAGEAGPQDFPELLLQRGVGPRALQSLALVSEVLYGTPLRFADPGRFSYAHGGKDGHPFPVPLRSYDVLIRHLRKAVRRAKVGRREKLEAMRRLDGHARRVEHRHASRGEQPPSWESLVEREWARAPSLCGRTVADDAPRRARPPAAAQGQLGLFG